MLGFSSVGRTASSPTYYEILGVSEDSLNEQEDPSSLVKRAYHRSLLRYHPDKTGAGHLPHSPGHDSPGQEPVTVDQISEAFAVLSDPRRRADYDRALRLAAQPGRARESGSNFQTGIESVDLDELDHDEAQAVWYRSCRCGNERGYVFTAQDLDDEADYGELMVGCQDCSLWLQVHFAVVQNVDEDASSGDGGRGAGTDERTAEGRRAPLAEHS